MTKTFAVALTAAMCAASALTLAQAKPDFSGLWSYNDGIAPIPRDVQRERASFAEMEIKQTATEIRLEGRAHQMEPWVATFKFDGTPYTFTNSSGTTKGTATWEGDKLAITTTLTFKTPMGTEATTVTKDVYGLVNGVMMITRSQTMSGSTGNATGKRELKYAYSKGPYQMPPPQAAPPGGCPKDVVLYRPCAMEKAKTVKLARRADGKPDLEGFWQIDGDETDTTPGQGVEAQPPSMLWISGRSMIFDPPDRKAPMRPWAMQERARRLLPENALNDPQGHCMNAAAPRQYFIQPFQIMQTESDLVFLHAVSHSYRVVKMAGQPHLDANIGMWNGDTVGHWEGDTLVTETDHANGKTHIDHAMMFTSNSYKFTDRWTMFTPDKIWVEMTVDDPKVYTRPWTFAEVMVRIKEKDYEILESACHEDNQRLKPSERLKIESERDHPSSSK